MNLQDTKTQRKTDNSDKNSAEQVRRMMWCFLLI